MRQAKRAVLRLAITSATVLINAIASQAAFTAQNDINWSSAELSGNITTGSPIVVTTVNLIDYDSATPTPVQASFSVSGGSCGRITAQWARPTVTTFRGFPCMKPMITRKGRL